MTTYNGKSRGYLEEAVKSVLSQTLSPREFIVVDDGSTDDTHGFLSASYPQINLIKTKNCGLPAARNTGIAAATGAWVAFIDDDDVWHPNKLETQYNAVINHQLDPSRTILVCPYLTLEKVSASSWENGGLVSPRTSWLGWPNAVLGNGVTSPSGVLLGKELVISVGGFDTSLTIGEDYDCWLRVFAAGASWHVISQPLVSYRTHSNQMSGSQYKRLKALWPLQLKYIERLPREAGDRAKAAVLANHFQIACRKLLAGSVVDIGRRIVSLAISSSVFRKFFPIFAHLELCKLLFRGLRLERLARRIEAIAVILCFSDRIRNPSKVEGI